MRARVLTALALIPLVLAAVFCQVPGVLHGLLTLVAVLALLELARLINVKPWWAFFLLPVAAIFAWKGQIEPVVCGVTTVAGAGALLASGTRWVPPALGTVLGSLWVLSPLAAILLLGRPQGPDTWNVHSPILMALVPLWIGDTAAIFVGKYCGRHKMAPTISPKKTWEGAGGNLLGCIVGAWLVGLWNNYPLALVIAVGVSTGVLGQVGDLFESYLKRRADLKDSGTLLPGHGGVLDRIDSMLMSAPAVAIALLLTH